MFSSLVARGSGYQVIQGKAEMHLARSHKKPSMLADLKLSSVLMSGSLATMDLTFSNAMVT